MNLYFDRVSSIVDEEYNALVSASYHGRDILCCDLCGTNLGYSLMIMALKVMLKTTAQLRYQLYIFTNRRGIISF